MEKAILSPLMVVLECPHCEEGTLSGPGGGNIWSARELREVRTARCSDCHQEFAVPQPGSRRYVVVRSKKGAEAEGSR